MKKKLDYFLNKTFKKKTIDCSNQILKHIKNKGKIKRYLSTINTYSLLLIDYDNKFNKALEKSYWLIPDGYGTVLACKILNIKIQQRITGADIFADLNFRINKHKNFKCMFFGSTKKTLNLIKKKMKIDYPNIKVAVFSPPFKKSFNKKENQKMIKFINKQKADILWVGLTQPKQEKWINQNINQLNIKFIAAVGAVFDFYSNKIKRAPKIIQNLKLEWMYRLLQDPKRLWKRYLIGNLNFFFCVIPYLLLIRFKYFFNFK